MNVSAYVMLLEIRAQGHNNGPGVGKPSTSVLMLPILTGSGMVQVWIVSFNNAGRTSQ